MGKPKGILFSFNNRRRIYEIIAIERAGSGGYITPYPGLAGFARPGYGSGDCHGPT
jgi:hypothetical protein